MSRALETALAQQVISALDGLVEVRVGEQLATINKEKVCVVNMFDKRNANTAFPDLYVTKFSIQLRMHYADNTTDAMDIAGTSIQEKLNTPNILSNVLRGQCTFTKKFITDPYWIQEWHYSVLAVDTES